MAIHLIGDLHLSFCHPKPMDLFGDNWTDHPKKIAQNWKKTVQQEDTVILLGDFSWEIDLELVYQDFTYIHELPGKKILLKGNHDYWWNTITKMNNYLKEKEFLDIDFLYNNSFYIENKIIAGTKGWNLNYSSEEEKNIKREVLRLEQSIQNGIKMYGEDKEIIVCLHHPPIDRRRENTMFIDILKKYNVKKCFYGHLHSDSHKDAVEGIVDGIEYKLLSCDYTDFKLYTLL